MAGWVNHRQLKVIDYLKEEKCVLREQLGGEDCGSRTASDDAWRRRAGPWTAAGWKRSAAS